MEKFAIRIPLLMSHINALIDSNWVHIGSTLRVAPPFTLFLWSVLVSLQYTLHSLQQQSKPIDYTVTQVPILMRTHPIFLLHMNTKSTTKMEISPNILQNNDSALETWAGRNGCYTPAITVLFWGFFVGGCYLFKFSVWLLGWGQHSLTYIINLGSWLDKH